MKNIHLIAILSFFLCSCNDDNNITVEEKAQEYTVSLAFCGEITISEAPISRATETESRDLYGIVVSSDKKGTFARGMFDNISDMKLNLIAGDKYQFYCTLIKNGKDVLNYTSIYNYPFRTNGNKINEFIYDGSGTYMDSSYLGKGTTENGTPSWSETDRYYGELNNYTPSINGVVNIPLKHTVFGLKYKVTGITDGTISLICRNSNQTFFSKSDIASDYESETTMFTFSDVKSAWQYADNYTEYVTVSVVWTRGIGIKQDLGSKDVQIKRNTMNVIRVMLGSEASGAPMGILTDGDIEMGVEDIEIPLS